MATIALEIMKPFPDGCGGCGGACCKDEHCPELLEDGRCRIQVHHGYESKPERCRDAEVGDPQCVIYRKQYNGVS